VQNIVTNPRESLDFEKNQDFSSLHDIDGKRRKKMSTKSDRMATIKKKYGHSNEIHEIENYGGGYDDMQQQKS
jgi:hypothetical protein